MCVYCHLLKHHMRCVFCSILETTTNDNSNGPDGDMGFSADKHIIRMFSQFKVEMVMDLKSS